MVVRRPGVRPGWVDDDLFPFESRFVRVDGHVVHHVDEGPFELDATDAPTLLMLHGNPTWSFLYRDVIPLLAGRFRCVAVDLPGFGLSSAAPGYGFTAAEHCAVLERVVEELGLTDVVPLVQDWGGPIGLGWAGRHRDRVRGLVVGNSWAWPVRTDPRLALFSAVAGGRLTRGLVARHGTFVEWGLPLGHRASSISEAEWTQWRGPFPDAASRLPTVVLAAEIRRARPLLAEVEAGVRDRLGDVPALLVWADRDIAFRGRELRRWQRLLPEATTVHLPRAGHFFPDDDPDGLARAVLAWWSASR